MFGLNDKLDPDWLTGVPFFDGFSGSELKAVSSLGERVEFVAGAEMIDQGRIGQTCYVIVEGSADVYIEGEFVAAVQAGSMVGEMALIGHRPRNATVVARDDLVAVSFGTEQFRSLLRRSPNAEARVNELLNARLEMNRDHQS